MTSNTWKYLASSVLFALALPFALVAASGAQPRLMFGALSDIHLSKPGDENYFIRALEYFRDHGADGVLCAGDLTENATVEQLERVAKCWFQVFPDGKAPEFAEDAAVTVEYKPGRDKDKGVVRVSFPSAQTVEESRVFEYEATASIVEDDIEIPLETHRFLANDMILAPSQAGKVTNHIEFACSRLPPQAHIRFAVRPYECFGKHGRWIYPMAAT